MYKINFFNIKTEYFYFQKNFMWNTVTIQYNPMIEEEWDEHFKVSFIYLYYNKTIVYVFPLIFTKVLTIYDI